MKKAFLSHNSADKLYVESIAKRLERDKTIFDKFVFHEAVDFRDAIQEGLSETKLFVLFASKESLKAPWVNYELDSAELELINGNIKNILIFLIGDISHEELPKWCRKKKIIAAAPASMAARIIKSNLIEVSGQKEVFIGREKELADFSNHRFYANEESHVLTFVGLEGQGRKSLAKEVIRNNYKLRLGPTFDYLPESTLVDLYVQLLHEEQDNLSKTFLEKAIKSFRETNLENQIKEILRILSMYIKYNIAPVIIDKGGLMKTNGQYKTEIISLIEEINKITNLYLILIQTRNPYGYNGGQPFFVTYVGELSKQSMNSLVFNLLTNLSENQNYDKKDIIELTDYLDGFPPVAYYAVHTIRKKGMALLLRDKITLTEFKAGKFTHYLRETIEDDKNIHFVLKILEALSPISYSVLETLVDFEADKLVQIMNELIDNSIVFVKEDKYSLASPLKDSVRALWGYLNKVDYRNMVKRFKGKYWDGENLPDYATLEVLIMLLLKADLDDELNEFWGIILPAEIIKAAKIAYYNKDWKLAEKLCLKSLELDAEKEEAKVLLVKCCIRLNNEPKANELLKQLKRSSHPKYNYLEGLKFLKKKDYQGAINSYKAALDLDDKTEPVYRGLAEAHYWIGEYEAANYYIETALKKNQNNKFIVDLAAKIAIEQEDFIQANKHISKLEIIDNKENVAHRKAILLSKQEQWEEALKNSKIACLGKHSLPEMFLTKAHIEIILNNLDEAKETLKKIKDSFEGYEKKDAFIGLEVKYYLAKNEYKLAEIHYNNLQKKDGKYGHMFKVQILKKKLEIVPLYEKEEVEKEIIELEKTNGFKYNYEFKYYESGAVD